MMTKTFWAVSDGYTFSKHATKQSAIKERELNKLDGFLDMNGLKSRWYIKQLKSTSSIYGSLT